VSVFPLPERYSRPAWTFGLLLAAAGLPLSKFLLSVSMFWIALVWLWEGNFSTKWARLKSPALWALIGFFLLHLLGLLYTENMKAGMHDVRIKLPLLVLAFLYGTGRQLSRKDFFLVLGIFIAATAASSVITAVRAAGWTGKLYPDIRDASPFVALIRLGLMAVFSMFLLAYFIAKTGLRISYKAGLLALAAWFVFFLIYLQQLTGLVVLLIAAFLVLCVYAVLQRRRGLALALLLLVGGAAGGAGFYVKHVYDEYYKGAGPFDVSKLETHTPRGMPYHHDTVNYMLENGNHALIYVSFPELQEEWAKRSGKSLLERNPDGHFTSYVLIRYLASKGLRRDADGVRALSDEEIRAIEKGATNYRFAEMNGITRRIYQVIWELDIYFHGGDPSDKSIPMRLELWKTSLAVIKAQPAIGVGTGDMPDTFKKNYEETRSRLSEKWRILHPHNQFLAIGVQFGLLGLSVFLFSLFYPGIRQKRFRNYFYLSFFCIVFVSFFNEDTLETQQGVMFYAFFNCLLLFAQPEKLGKK